MSQQRGMSQKRGMLLRQERKHCPCRPHSPCPQHYGGLVTWVTLLSTRATKLCSTW